jgi:hypothetical protein
MYFIKPGSEMSPAFFLKCPVYYSRDNYERCLGNPPSNPLAKTGL